MQFKNLLKSEDWFSKAAFFVLLAILVSLAFSIRFMNSVSIILLVALAVLHPSRKQWSKEALGNSCFLASAALIFWKFAGMLYTENTEEGWWQVTSKASLLAIPYFFAGYQLNQSAKRSLMIVFTVSLAIVSVICLGNAAIAFQSGADPDVFFYHRLVLLFKHHAIFFSFYLFFCIVYWLEEGLNSQREFRYRHLVIALLFFFYGMILLLSSKLVLVVAIVHLLYWILRRSAGSKLPYIKPALFFFITASLLVVFFTNNPVKSRFADLANGNEKVFMQEQFTPETYLNGLQFRLLTWRFTYEILSEQKAWIHGVSPADAQTALDQKYVDVKLYQGDGGSDRGYLAFNCHNAFLQVTLESGLVGLGLLLLIILAYIREAIRRCNRGAIIFFVSIIAFCFTESVLSSQYTLLLFLFFPLLMLNGMGRTKMPQP